MTSASAVIADPPPSDHPSSFDCLQVPPLDPLFFSSSDPIMDPNSIPGSNPINAEFDLDFLLDENADFEFTFDNLDDLYLPSETESFLIPNNTSSSTTSFADHFSGDRASDDRVPHSEGDGMEGRGGSPDRELSAGMASSQGSGGGRGSGLSEDLDSPSPCSGNSDRDRDVSSEFLPEQKVKLEASGNNGDHGAGNGLMKRKKGRDDVCVETRTTKFRKSMSKVEENVSSMGKVESLKEEEGDEKRKSRLMRNRESAQLSRQRKKHYVEELEEKVRAMHSTITDLNSKISFIMAENVSLRQQLGSAAGGGLCAPPMAPPHPGMYPHPAMPYPWMPCPPYVVKPQGSQVPLVPIPRMKPQQPTAAAVKAKKRDSKKVESKSTKKVASISLLGVLFFMLLFGGLVPMVNVRYGGDGEAVPGRFAHFGKLYNIKHYNKGRILTVSGHGNVSYPEKRMGRGCGGGSDQGIEEQRMRHANASEPLVASLYVPRNNKLVKIDGNLIIHSVLASEKAMASQASHKTENKKAVDLAMRRNLASALAIPESTMIRGNHHAYRKPAESQRALASGGREMLNDRAKSTSATDGKLQQWFREGLAGPLLSSGMCTEVFHFDVSPASAGAIVPASPASNITSVERRNTTNDRIGKNRRILDRIPYRLAGTGINITNQEAGGNSKREDLQANKSLSSMVVSVLVDPREAGDGDMDGMIRPKSISRIFVVVLMDSIKYVTYSCMLPLSGVHFVTT